MGRRRCGVRAAPPRGCRTVIPGQGERICRAICQQLSGATFVADTISPEARSALMARIRGRDTKPEVAVRRLLFRRGWRYRLHARGLPGRPDIFFPGRQAAIFVHGCFWHGHRGCDLATVPKTRTAFWCDKVATNQARDARAVTALHSLGWATLTIWQCEIERDPSLIPRIETFLLSRSGVERRPLSASTRKQRFLPDSCGGGPEIHVDYPREAS
jgi:DNA mismatch endonuclease, patch repair protein